MAHRFLWILLLISCIVFSSCVEQICDTGSQTQLGSQARLRVLNTSPDARSVDVFINNKLEPWFTDITYCYVIGYNTDCSLSNVTPCYHYVDDAAQHTIQIRKGGVTLATTTFVLRQRSKYTLIIYDYADRLQVKILEDNGNSDVDISTSRLRFFNAGPDAGNINLRLHSKNNPNEFPDPGLAFGDTVNYKDFPSGVRGFYLINQNDPNDEILGIDSTYLFSPLTPQAFFTVVNVGLRHPFGDQPIATAIILNDSGFIKDNCLAGGPITYLPIVGIRLVNAAAQFDSIDMRINDRKSFPRQSNVLNVHYGEASRDYMPYNTLVKDFFDKIEISLPGDSLPIPFATRIDSFFFTCNSLTTILAVNTSLFGTSPRTISLIPIRDTIHLAATFVSVRFFNASVDADTILSITMDGLLQPWWSNAPFLTGKPTTEINAGSHTIQAVGKNGTSPQITYNFVVGKTYTILALPQRDMTDAFTLTVVEH